MAYTTTSSVKRSAHSGGSRDSLNQLQQPTYSQQQPSYSHAQQSHIYEEQPYYANEQSISRQNIGGESRRPGEVCNVFFLILLFSNKYDE
jgi:hypothetical protein